MARTNQKLSKLIDALPKYFLEKSKVECPENLKEKALERLIEQMKGEEINTIDGVKVWFKDRSAILVRPSGTEPIYRLYAEAKTAKRVRQLVAENSSRLRKIISSLQE
jgi:phosphomannomutase/phosphoglucomutase